MKKALANIGKAPRLCRGACCLRDRFDGAAVAKGGNAAFAQGTHAEVERNAQRVDPYALRHGKGKRHKGIGERLACGEYDDRGDAERVERDGEQPADGQFQRRVSDQFSRKISAQRGDEGNQASAENIPRADGGNEVCDQAAHEQRGHAFRVKEG